MLHQKGAPCAHVARSEFLHCPKKKENGKIWVGNEVEVGVHDIRLRFAPRIKLRKRGVGL